MFVDELQFSEKATLACCDDHEDYNGMVRVVVEMKQGTAKMVVMVRTSVPPRPTNFC